MAKSLKTAVITITATVMLMALLIWGSFPSKDPVMTSAYVDQGLLVVVYNKSCDPGVILVCSPVLGAELESLDREPQEGNVPYDKNSIVSYENEFYLVEWIACNRIYVRSIGSDHVDVELGSLSFGGSLSIENVEQPMLADLLKGDAVVFWQRFPGASLRLIDLDLD